MLDQVKAGAGAAPPDPDRRAGANANAVDAISDVLQSDVDIHRCAAARALGVMRDARAVEPLIKALLDEDPDVRTDAAEALAAIGDTRAAGPLLENLIGDPCSDVKQAAIRSLVAMEHPDAATWLVKFLSWHHDDIAWDDEEYYEGGWDSWVDLQIAATKGLGQLGAAGAVPAILAAIEDQDGQDLTEAAFPVLAQMGDAGVAALAGFLDDNDVRRRRRAAASLASLENAVARSAVERALADPSAEVRLAVVRTLVDRNSGDSLPVNLLADPDPEIRALAAVHCRELTNETVQMLMDDPADAVQAAAITRIASQPIDEIPVEGAAWIERCLQDGGEEAAAAAAAALPLILGVDAVGALSQVLNDETRALPVRLAALRESDDVAALIPALTNGERQIRMTALSILGRLAASEKWPNVASAALLAALSGELASPPESTDSTEPDTKEEQTDSAEPEDAKEMDSYPTSSWQAIMAASGANDARAELGDTNENGIRLTQADMEYLALSKQTPRKGRAKLTRAVPLHLDLPWAAAKILGDVQERDAALALTVKLEAALSSDDKPMRQAATDSLARIGEKLGGLPAETFPVLARAAADGDQVCRHLAVRALGFSGNDQARDIFVGLLRDKDSLIRAEAITALACVGAAGSSFEDHLGDQERSVRLAAADALAKQRGTGAFDLLIEYTFAGEGRDRRPAARLLRQIDRQAASASFVHVLQDASRLRERIIAIEALEELYMT